LGSGKANAAPPGVENRVKTFKERVAIDKVEPRSHGRSDVVDYKVHAPPLAADVLVECAGPDLHVRGELERPVPDGEEERLEVGVLGRGDSKKLRGRVEDCARSTAVAVKRVYMKRGVFQVIYPEYKTHIW
jgi:hypothetical protein